MSPKATTVPKRTPKKILRFSHALSFKNTQQLGPPIPIAPPPIRSAGFSKTRLASLFRSPFLSDWAHSLFFSFSNWIQLRPSSLTPSDSIEPLCVVEILFLGVSVVFLQVCGSSCFTVVVGFGLPDLRRSPFQYGCDPTNGMVPLVGVGSNKLFWLMCSVISGSLYLDCGSLVVH